MKKKFYFLACFILTGMLSLVGCDKGSTALEDQWFDFGDSLELIPSDGVSAKGGTYVLPLELNSLVLIRECSAGCSAVKFQDQTTGEHQVVVTVSVNYSSNPRDLYVLVETSDENQQKKIEFVQRGTEGSEESPHYIINAKQMYAFAEEINAGDNKEGVYFLISNNINLQADAETDTKVEWSPVGTSLTPFVGSLNGNGYTVSGLYINQPSKNSVAMFSHVGSTAVISNLKVSGEVKGRDNVAGLVAYNFGTIKGCSYAGTVDGNDQVGGLVSVNNSEITLSSNSASVTATGDQVGGLVARADANSVISECSNSGSVSSDADQVGGLVGNAAGVVRKSSNSGRVGGVVGDMENVVYIAGRQVGGVIGANSAVIDSLENSGKVYGTTYVGGIVGENKAAAQELKGLVNSADVRGYNYVGGVFGDNDASQLVGSVNSGRVEGDSNVGGLIGRNLAAISNSSNSGAVKGETNVGGLFGTNSGKVQNFYNTGSVTATSSPVGGIVGSDTGELLCGYNIGAVTGATTPGKQTGAIAGECKTILVSVYSLEDCVSAGSGGVDGTSKTKAEMQQKEFVTLLNTSQDPVAWQAVTDNYPVFAVVE